MGETIIMNELLFDVQLISDLRVEDGQIVKIVFDMKSLVDSLKYVFLLVNGKCYYSSNIRLKMAFNKDEKEEITLL